MLGGYFILPHPVVLVIVLVGNVFVLELVLGTSVLETSLPIINPNPNLKQASSDRECPMCLQRHLSNILKYFLGYRSRTQTPNANLKP